MKIHLFKFCLLGTLLSLFACNDMLDNPPLDRFENNPDFWNNPDNVEGITNSFYNSFTAYGNNGGYGLFYFPSISDNQVGNPFQDWEYTSIPATSSAWNNGWTKIRLANTIISNVEQSSLSPSHKSQFIAIARLMRAWHYFILVQRYGDLQWIDTPLSISDTTTLYGARISRDIIMDNILLDLEFATENMPISSSKITWSRNMAYAMKADICLWEGTFRKYRTFEDNLLFPDINGSERFLNACIDACQYLFSQEYSLCPDYQSIYNSIDLTGNPEIIFFKPYRQGVLSHSLIAYTSSSTTQNGISKDAFDSYLFLDGKPLTLTSLPTDDSGVLQFNPDSTQLLINISSMLAVRDKRLSATIDSILCFKGSTWPRTPDGMPMTSTTGYTIRKYDNTSIPADYRTQTASNYTCAPIFWLSVIYLNYAEAKAELGTISQPDLDISINRLNARAGLPDFNLNSIPDDPANHHLVSPLIWEIRRARRCELICDNDYRYWDLVRWHQLDKLDTSSHPDIILGANIQNIPYPQVYTLNNYILATNSSRTFSPRYYLYPIPSSELSLNPFLTQNPFW